MMVKSVLTTGSETIEDDIDDESATHQDSAINLDKVYKHWKSTKTRRNNLKYMHTLIVCLYFDKNLN